MTEQEQNELIARFMGYSRIHKGTLSERWARPMKRFPMSPPNYTTDANALGEVLEKIRKEVKCIQVDGDEDGWAVTIYDSGKGNSWKKIVDLPYSETEQAAKVAAVVAYIKAKEDQL